MEEGKWREIISMMDSQANAWMDREKDALTRELKEEWVDGWMVT
jgi:hypothetical protein